MKLLKYFIPFTFFALLVTGCAKDEIIEDKRTPEPQNPDETVTGKDIPEGYFEVVFSADPKRAVEGQDGRIQELYYILFKADGTFVKEKNLFDSTSGVQNWPITAVRDTIPKGSYKAIFAGNMNTSVLSGYRAGFASGRITMPSEPFTANTEYYMSTVAFSDTEPNPNILLQRIISCLNVHRNNFDTQEALDALLDNIMEQVDFGSMLTTQINNILPGYVRPIISAVPGASTLFLLIGGVDGVVDDLVDGLIEPALELLMPLVRALLVDQLGAILAGNADQGALLGIIGELINPWQAANTEAIVTLNNFPKTIDFNRNLTESFAGEQSFRFEFSDTGFTDQKDVLIKGFSGLYDIRKINVIRQGLIGGLVIDGLLDDSWLLPGMFVDITDPISFTPETNRRYKADYSILDLGLDSYTPQTEGAEPLSVTLNLGEIANLGNVLSGLPLIGNVLSGILGTILSPLESISVGIPVNVPLLGIENLSISGGWSAVTPMD